MTALYPLRLEPLLKRYLWGGRRLGTVLGKPLDFGNDFAESWEVVDRGEDQSVVENGPLRGLTLHELVARWGTALLGRHAPQARFPLLFKYLDCNQVLSVQVHPTDAAAALLDPPDLGKTEAWLVLEARPGSVVYAGLRPGIDQPALARAVAHGQVAECLNAVTPRAGDCFFIPAGAVHALGAGLLVAEIQQSSDVTFRLDDWGRVGPDGKPRTTHLDQALAATDFSAVDIRPQLPEATQLPHVERLVACDKFVLDCWRHDEPQSLHLGDRFHILSVLDGELTVSTTDVPDAADETSQLILLRGQTVLLPASVGKVAIIPRGECRFLDIYLP
jgi:mannose-6-phosphate isomerase